MSIKKIKKPSHEIEEKSEVKEAILSAKKSFLAAGFFSIFVNILMLVPPLYMLQLYDRVVTSRSNDTLIMLTALVVVLFITMSALEIVRSKILMKIANKLDAQLSSRVFNTLFDLANKRPGKATSQPMSDLTSLKQFLTGNGVFAFFDAPWLPVYIVILYLFHPYFAYFAIFAALVLLTFTIINEYVTKEKLQDANNLNRDANIFVDANLRNAEVINAMGMKRNILTMWQTKYFSFLNAQNEASAKAGIWANISKTTRMLFQSLMLGLGGYLSIHDEVTAGMMIAGSIMLGRALAPLDLMINSWKQFSSARTSYSRLNSLLDEFPEKKEYMELPAPTGELLLEDIVVIPPASENPSVAGVSMRINKGDVVGLIGPSAAGKSSLARAILGIWPLAAGTVRLDGADIHQWDKTLLGKYIGYLPQDVELFYGTVSQNIARFEDVDSAKVVEAAKKAGVHEMILRLPEGYDTIIGVGGASLSGGQRQRVGFARAIYDNPIFVVLDEPNSNLDDQGEAALVRAIAQLRTLKTTVILITHRPAILQVTNKVAVMKDGKLEAYGPTNEILGQMQAAVQKAQAQAAAQAEAKKNATLTKPGS